MKKEKFIELWGNNVFTWLDKTIEFNNKNHFIKDFCTIKDGIVDKIYSYYEIIKNVTKECYFKNYYEECYLNRYKRAAVLIYAILLSNPLNYKLEAEPILVKDKKNLLNDKLYLKQQLAFKVALSSIIQDYPKEKVIEEMKHKNKKIFDFDSLNKLDLIGDNFLLSIYKDLYNAEIFENYNVLTMANLLGVLTEKVSILGNIKPICD